MPELPDITVYIEALEKRILGREMERAVVAGPLLLRTTKPALEEAFGREVKELRRVGKRIAIGMDNGIWLVLHLMIAGRLHWKPGKVRADGRRVTAAFYFADNTLTLTEAGSQKRASLHVVAGEKGLAEMDPGGLEVMEATGAEFAKRLLEENHTLKRALTDPQLFSGIGNAYSDEILHRAKLSPVTLTQRLQVEEVMRLLEAAKESLKEWTERVRADAGGKFPEKVTAFREGMAVHGRFGKPCPRCATVVQRIKYAENETNYCPTCQTGGKLLADRGLSRLLHEDWPRTLEEMENRKRQKRTSKIELRNS